MHLDNPDAVRSPRAFLTTAIVNLASDERRSWSRRERLSRRMPSGDPADVLATARARGEARPGSRSHRFLAATAAAVLAVVALAAGGLALTAGGESDSLTVAGPQNEDTAGATVTVSVSGVPGVEASTSSLTPSHRAWLQHTVTLRNTGTEDVRLSDFRGGGTLGADEVAVATEGCTFGESTSVGCLTVAMPPVLLEPGATHELTIHVWRDLPGMNPVTDATYVWELPVQAANRPAAMETDANGSLTLTYDDLAGDAASPRPLACGDITRFADSLDDTGITYDHEASPSPRDLADRSDAVFAGTLTGAVTDATDPEFGDDHVGFEVQVSEHYETDGARAAETVTVLLAVGSPGLASEWADLVPAGAPVVVFAHRPAGSTPGHGPSVVANPVQGIVTACDDDLPIGLVSTRGDWPSLTTLADIQAALTPRTGGGATEQGGVDGPVLYGPGQHDLMQQAQVTGRLSLRADCLHLHGEGAEAEYPLLPVVWPNGTTWEENPEGVRLPDATFVPVGATVTASGGFPDIGRLVELGHGEAVADRAQACDVEGTRFVAYVQGEVTVGADELAVEGDTAVWDVDAGNPPPRSARSVTVMVTRLGCSGGETGKVLAPDVSADAEQVVVTFSVESLPGGAYPCPGNDSVPYVIELGEPLGDRELIDGACLSGEARSTSFCADGAVRWPAPA